MWFARDSALSTICVRCCCVLCINGVGGNGMVNPGHKQLYFVGFNDFLGLIDEIAREVPQMAANVKKELAQLK